MTSLVDIFEELAYNLSLEFYAGSKAYQNFTADSGSFPALYLDYPITKSYLMHTSGAIDEKIDVSFILADEASDGLDSTYGEHNDVHVAMYRYARKIMRILSRRDEVIGLENIRSETFENAFDAALSGIIVTMQLTLRSDDSACALSPLTIDSTYVTIDSMEITIDQTQY